MSWSGRLGALALCALAAVGCGGDLTPVRGTTIRAGRPAVEPGTELELRLFTTEADCVANVGPANLEQCLPYVDRASGEVRVGFQFRLDSDPFPLPLTKENLRVIHQGTEVLDGVNGQSYTIVPHEPVRAPQLFILVIDGSSSMLENNRMETVRSALLLPEVIDSFFPGTIRTAVVVMTFTDDNPEPLGGVIKVIENRKEYTNLVRNELRVLNGFTHMYRAVSYATGELLNHPEIKRYLEVSEAQPTIIALTDGYNNLAGADQCRDNAPRLSTLLKHLEQQRSGDVDLRKRPSVFTVGLGKPLRGRFVLPDKPGTEVRPVDLCGKSYVDRRIDGDLERYGIDNASLAYIADAGGGFSYVKRDKKGLGEAFRGAAAERFRWFEARYRIDPFYLRRAFRVRLRLLSFAAAEASVMLYPSAWLDAPPGVRGADGWHVPQSYRHTATLVMPALGLLGFLSYLGAAGFNTRRALFRRGSAPPPAGPSAPPPGSAPPSPPPGAG